MDRKAAYLGQNQRFQKVPIEREYEYNVLDEAA